MFLIKLVDKAVINYCFKCFVCHIKENLLRDLKLKKILPLV